MDRVSIHMFAANLEDNLAALMRDLKTGKFRPRPLRRVYTPKGPGSTKFRPLGTAEKAAHALEAIRQWVTSAGLTLRPEKTHIVDSRVSSFGACP